MRKIKVSEMLRILISSHSERRDAVAASNRCFPHFALNTAIGSDREGAAERSRNIFPISGLDPLFVVPFRVDSLTKLLVEFSRNSSRRQIRSDGGDDDKGEELEWARRGRRRMRNR